MRDSEVAKEVRTSLLNAVEKVIPAQAQELERLRLENQNLHLQVEVAKAQRGAGEAQERLMAASSALAIINPGLPALVLGKPEAVQRITGVYDSALGINPPEKQKNLQMRYNSWIPDGIWKINGKLDPNFVDWLAKDWQKAYGGDLHKKRADVLRHFKKDPANIAIAWTQYEAETRHRYENAALRMNNGVEIKPDEQQQLLSRSRAVSERMSEEVNPVAVDVMNPNYLTQIEGGKEENVIEYHHEVKPVINSNNVGVTSSNNSSFPAAEDKQGDGINPLDSSQPSERSERVASSTPPKDIPRNEKGSAENPEAYSMWKPEKLEGEEINPLQLRERLADLSQRFAMSKPIKERKPPKDPIEELNEWLADPVLRNTAMSKILDNDSLSVEFDEQGIPIQVIKISS
ncbi:MAG: hypothetical protein AB4368_17100 [Xenococcaceae cyanobacterium]